MENGFKVPTGGKDMAFLIEKGVPTERLTEVLNEAKELRKAGNKVLVVRMNKNKKFQKEQLTAEGYTEIEEIYAR